MQPSMKEDVCNVLFKQKENKIMVVFSWKALTSFLQVQNKKKNHQLLGLRQIKQIMLIPTNNSRKGQYQRFD